MIGKAILASGFVVFLQAPMAQAAQKRLLSCSDLTLKSDSNFALIQDSERGYLLTESLPRVPYLRQVWLPEPPVKVEDHWELRIDGAQGRALIFETEGDWVVEINLGPIVFPRATHFFCHVPEEI